MNLPRGERIALIGTGAVAEEVVQIFGADRFVACFTDAAYAAGARVDIPIVTDIERLPGVATHFVLGFSGHAARDRLRDRLLALGLQRAAPLVAPMAQVSPSAVLAPGVMIGHFVCVGPRVEIGADTLVMHTASIAHDSHVGADVFCGQGAKISGHARVGARSALGAKRGRRARRGDRRRRRYRVRRRVFPGRGRWLSGDRKPGAAGGAARAPVAPTGRCRPAARPDPTRFVVLPQQTDPTRSTSR